jgi:hypothetical protein
MALPVAGHPPSGAARVPVPPPASEPTAPSFAPAPGPTATALRKAHPDPFVFNRFIVSYNAINQPTFRLFTAAAPAGQNPRPVSLDQISRSAFDNVNNALRINATPGAGQGQHTPSNADQVFASVFDTTSNALRVNCIVGCSSVTLGGDLSGSMARQTVVGLSGRPVAPSAPSPNQVLTWNGSEWAPITPATGAGTGNCGPNQLVSAVNAGGQPSCIQPGFGNLSGTVASNQLPVASASVQGALQLTTDLAGTGNAPLVAGLQGHPIAAAVPAANQFLGWNSGNSQWQPVQPGFSNVSGIAGASQLPGATTGSQGALVLAKDLGGSSTSPQVIGLQGNPVQAVVPGSGQVLTWNGSSWTPTNPAIGAQIAQDLGGTVGSPKVVGLQGNAVASTAPAANQFLGWNAAGTQWQPAQPAFSNLGGTAASSQLPAATGAAQGAVTLTKDLGGTSASPQVVGLQGNAVSSQTPSSSQVLTWNGSSWTPTNPAIGAQIAQDLGGTVGSPKVVGLQGNAVASGTPAANQFLGWNVASTQWQPAQPAFSNLDGTAASSQLPAATGAAQGAVTLTKDLGGTSASPQVVGLQGNAVASTTPAANQFLGWNAAGTQWQPAQPAFSNLGGTASSSQLPAATGAAQGAVILAKDLGGTSAPPQVVGLQGNAVSSQTPSSNQVLAWNGSSWTPTNPAPGGAQIAQDLGGTVGSPKVVGLQGNAVASTTPAANQFLGWNAAGTQWQPAQPAFSNLGGTATSGQLPAAAGAAQGAVTLAKDLGGTSASPQVVGLQGNAVSSQTPSSNQVLTWNGSSWTPANPATGVQIAQDLGGSVGSPKVVGLQGNAVASTAPAANQFLGWNAAGTQWQPAQPAFSNLTGTASASQIANPAGDLTGTYAASTVTAVHFGTTGIPFSPTPPTSGQCIYYTGAAIGGTSCGSGSGGVNIGGPIGGGTSNSLLFLSSSGNLAQDNSNLNYNPATYTLFAQNLSGALPFSSLGASTNLNALLIGGTLEPTATGAIEASSFVSQHHYTDDGAVFTNLAAVVAAAQTASYKTFDVDITNCGENIGPSATGNPWKAFSDEHLHLQIKGGCDGNPSTAGLSTDVNLVLPDRSALLYYNGGFSSNSGTFRGAVIQPTAYFAAHMPVADPTVAPTWSANASCSPNNSAYTSGSVYAVVSAVNVSEIETRFSPQSAANTGMSSSLCAQLTLPTPPANAAYWNIYLESSADGIGGANSTFYTQIPVSQTSVVISAANPTGALTPSEINLTGYAIVIQDGGSATTGPWASGTAFGTAVWGISVDDAQAGSSTTDAGQGCFGNADGEELSGFYFTECRNSQIYSWGIEGGNGKLHAINSQLIEPLHQKSSLPATACGAGVPCEPGAILEANNPVCNPTIVCIGTARLRKFEGMTGTPNTNNAATWDCVDVVGSLSPAVSPGEATPIRGTVHCEGPGTGSAMKAAVRCSNTQTCDVDSVEGINGPAAVEVLLDSGVVNAHLTNVMAIPSDCAVKDTITNINCTTTPGFATGAKVGLYDMSPAGALMDNPRAVVQPPGGNSHIFGVWAQNSGGTKTEQAWWDSNGNLNQLGLTGLVRGGTPLTAAELSQDVTTNGSNVATVTGIRGHAVGSITPAVLGDDYRWSAIASAFEPTTAGDNLQFTDNGTASASRLDFTADDPTTVNVDEEFLGGGATSGFIGALGWSLTSIGATANITVASGALPNLGEVRLSSAATATDAGAITLSVGALGALGNTSNPWSGDWIFELSDTSGVAGIGSRVGLANTVTTVVPTYGMYLCYDTSTGCGGSGNTGNFYFCMDLATGAETCVNTTQTPSNSAFVRVRIDNLRAGVATAGYVRFQLFSSAGALLAGPTDFCSSGCANSTAPPSGSVTPLFNVISYTTASAEAITVDAFKFKMRGLAR